MEQLPIAIIYTILLCVLPLISIVLNLIHIIYINNLNVKDTFILMKFTLLLLLPAIIIVLSLINSIGCK